MTDEQAWQQRCAELAADEPAGPPFLEFLTDWVDLAENLMWEGTGGHRYPVPHMEAAVALRMALPSAEQRHGGVRVSSHFLGQMLAVVLTHWEHGKQLRESLTLVERRLAEDALALKISRLTESAMPEESEAVGDD